MLKRILQGIAILGAAAVVVALSMTWVIVSVVIPGEGLRLWIPAPVVLAQGAAALVNPPELHQAVPVEARYLRAAAAALRELEDIDDAELVRVESEDETVVIRVEAGRIHIEADDASDHVRVHAPVRQLRRFLEGRGDESFRPAEIFHLARSLPSGPLVEFTDPETSVSVSVW